MNVFHLIVAVAEDLYTFARDIVVAMVPARGQRTAFLPPSQKAPVLVSKNIEAEPEDNPKEEGEVQEEIPLTFRSTADILKTPHNIAQKNTVMYTGSEETPVFREATIEFDGIVARIPYGAMVMVLENKGRWARIVYEAIAGWVVRDELLDRSAHVYPDFTIGTSNLADDPNTLRVRACINDEFGGGVAGFPLQSSEYVTYRLQKRGLSLPWTGVRPRIEGTWHELLRGMHGVRMNVQPQSGAIMEYVMGDGTGHLTYVEAVFPDGTLRVSETNFPEAGIYNERVITKEEWQELRPVFIEVHAERS